MATFISGGISQITQDPPIDKRGRPAGLHFQMCAARLAMAKQPGDPDSAKSEWFFNQVDNNDPTNPDNLDDQNGGFTVFSMATESGMSVVDEITLLPICYDLIPARLLRRDHTPVGFYAIYQPGSGPAGTAREPGKAEPCQRSSCRTTATAMASVTR